LVAISIAAALALVFAGLWNDCRIGKQKLERLVSGDSDVHIGSVEFRGQMRRVGCTDRTVLDYLEASLRRATRNPREIGTVCQATFYFNGGGTCTAALHVWCSERAGISLSVPSWAPEADVPTHDVPFAEPIPGEVTSFFARLQ